MLEEVFTPHTFIYYSHHINTSKLVFTSKQSHVRAYGIVSEEICHAFSFEAGIVNLIASAYFFKALWIQLLVHSSLGYRGFSCLRILPQDMVDLAACGILPKASRIQLLLTFSSEASRIQLLGHSPPRYCRSSCSRILPQGIADPAACLFSPEVSRLPQD